ncbi:MAG: phosphatidylserine decarboxylase family protein [Deltaproteobacteria bacterium]|nr:phosphatidylserine decarboxylase family protein [Deltaproteobacteria bacterium]
MAKEAYPFILGALALCLLAFLIHPFLTIPFVLFLFFVLYFFRDPSRVIPQEAGILVSPADGVVVQVEELPSNPYLPVPVKKIAIFMSPFNVHVNRSPAEGTVEEVRYKSGKFLMAMKEEASIDNEQNAVILRLKEGSAIAFVQIAGFLARRIVCYLKKGDSIGRGEKMGLIRFGSRVDVYLPLNFELKVSKGDVVVAGETVLARM